MLGPLFLPAIPSDIPDIAVGVCRYNGYFHAAIFYRDDLDRLRLLELFISGEIGSQSLDHARRIHHTWAIPKIHADLRDSVRELCHQIGKNRPEVWYGFKYSPSEFQVDGSSVKVTLGGDTVGFTCATFVLAIFDSLGLSLIEHETWRPRPNEDEAEQRSILNWATQSVPPDRPFGIAADVMQRNAVDIPCIRYRCEEVIAACQLDRPSRFRTTEFAGKIAKRWIISSDEWQAGGEP